MPSRENALHQDPKTTLAPQSIGGAVTGTGVDLAGCEAATIIVETGAASTVATIKVQESDDNSTFTDVADADLIGLTGNPSGFATTASSIRKVAYVGGKRYVRVSTTAGSAALLSACVVRTRLRHVGGVAV
ncbi:hypothetical protein [Paraconexibacter algicola]|uniref:F5/8 type C domain-containing protein n=1 Tax=Paraconexibacter algicola TaxID=2133960 RepID=A0A2T4UE14_9ACTN|nr:hypothetical protein [Paraconexibacter algicola]PTL55746.1 hypothetical protein C7Y72_19140 [Paraconexibacter algicola]